VNIKRIDSSRLQERYLQVINTFDCEEFGLSLALFCPSFSGLRPILFPNHFAIWGRSTKSYNAFFEDFNLLSMQPSTVGAAL